MIKKMMKKFKNERGLTLVELLAVIVILAIIAVIAFVLIGNVIDNAKKDAHIANAQQLISSAKLWEAEGNEIGEGIGAGQLKHAGLLDKIIDPWTKKTYEKIGGDDAAGTNALVKKDGNEYKVTLTPETAANCSISNKESEIIENGRDVCNKATTP